MDSTFGEGAVSSDLHQEGSLCVAFQVLHRMRGCLAPDQPYLRVSLALTLSCYDSGIIINVYDFYDDFDDADAERDCCKKPRRDSQPTSVF